MKPVSKAVWVGVVILALASMMFWQKEPEPKIEPAPIEQPIEVSPVVEEPVIVPPSAVEKPVTVPSPPSVVLEEHPPKPRSRPKPKIRKPKAKKPVMKIPTVKKQEDKKSTSTLYPCWMVRLHSKGKSDEELRRLAEEHNVSPAERQQMSVVCLGK